MAETDEFYLDNQLDYETETLERGDGVGEVEDAGADIVEDPELEVIKAKVRQMEVEAEKLKQLHSEVIKQRSVPISRNQSLKLSLEEKMDVDNRSIFIGNVDYKATIKDVEEHFYGCGSINRVTIPCSKFTGRSKGFAYVEFTDQECVSTAMAMDDSLFKGRQIKVMQKRTNKPGISTTNRVPRGRGCGGKGNRGRGFGGKYMGGYRGRGASYYIPY